MNFSRLRLSGFKSFVEPVDVHIEPGLTGVVGPNGCGKSNLLEALRWVMGESSYKSMRASGMDDVIFSGTTQRPSRNMAEVMVTLDNDDRSAPAQYNDGETIEISRRIEREAGSAYRINGRDVRARDVQLLFADASTGARSPALVRQGQIAEIISAKPQARRLILEEAAGITGLHTRRHEAELKLKAAEQNLARLEDVTAQLETQLNSLKRQARQAQKYKTLSAEIRKLEAAGLYVGWKDAAAALAHDQERLDQATRQLAEHTRVVSESLRKRDELGDRLPGIREQETVRAAALQRLTQERHALDEEERRAEARASELGQRHAQIATDLAREQDQLADTNQVVARLSDEDAALIAANAGDGERRSEAALLLQQAAETLARSQDAADQANERLSDLAARRNTMLRGIEEQKARIDRLVREKAETEAELGLLVSADRETGGARQLAGAVESAAAAAAAAEAVLRSSEERVRDARQTDVSRRQVHDEARRRADSLQTEVRTLTKLLKAGGGELWPALIDTVRVAPGYEMALGAALGDDIDASADEAAPVHWRSLAVLERPAPLPGGAEPLSNFVESPPALRRKLSYTGLVERGAGPLLQPDLQPGQRLVSRQGDLWRWDGFTAAADAPSAAAKRLAERNRLVTLEDEMRQALASADSAREEYEAARQSLEEAAGAESEQREAWRALAAVTESARQALAEHERQSNEQLVRRSALEEARRRIDQSLADLHAQHDALAAEADSLPALDGLHIELGQLRGEVERRRAAYGEQRAHHDGLERDARMRAERSKAIAAEQGQWQERARRAKGQIEALAARADETRAAIAELEMLPQLLAVRRARLMDLLGEAEAARREAADALAHADNELRAADQHLRTLQEQLAASRAEEARLGARLEAARERHEACEMRIAENLQCTPSEIVAVAGLDPAAIPPGADIERRLLVLREDRERLGGVNLRAEEEAGEVARQLDGLVRERDDLAQAIGKLRGAISSLNREGRQRLLDAFGTVNEKFGELFTTLFGGGRAELQLIESDDPLEAGLEILAHPPGKKPTVLSLLSGGEQTLTALSLIFAVFLTNPSPICVLDEVDAPLDDHNVERFCNLLDAMLERTDTRFLIITHHALTMARMHRLFGVTMMERGVSQLVSVNLQEAEAMREAS